MMVSEGHWDLHTSHTGWIETGGTPLTPVLHLQFGGHSEELIDQMSKTGTGNEYPEDIDIAFQLRTSPDDSNATGVLAVSDRLTGEYLLELEVATERIFAFVRCVHEYADATGDEVEYIVSLDAEDGTAMEFQKNVLLVRMTDGELYRSRSLIPPWVEF